VVFAGLGFRLDGGGALMLLGPNGSGKSSLLRLMAGLAKPAAGQLAWNGRDIATDREAHAVQLHYVGHHDAVKPVLTVWENLRLWACLRDPLCEDAALASALAAFGLDRLAEMPGKLLSAGQKRRLALARLLAAPAPLWLLDEPTVALDHASVLALETVVAAHRAHGGMVAVSTHADMALPGAANLYLDHYPAPEATDAGDWI